MALTASTHTQPTSSDGIGSYVSIELPIRSMGAVYQSRLWNVALKGLCFVVKDGSAIISHLHVGDILSARYRTDIPGQPETIADTRIRHITHETTGRFKGHHLVGLSIIDAADLKTE